MVGFDYLVFAECTGHRKVWIPSETRVSVGSDVSKVVRVL